MRPMKIPPSARKAFVALVRLDESQFRALVSAIQKSPAQFSKTPYVDEVVKAVPQIETEAVRSIVGELFSVEYLRNEDDSKSVPAVAKLISESIPSDDSDGVPFSDDDRSVLKSRICEIFDVRKSLSLTAKSTDAVTDQDRVFIKAHVRTDIRPVFNDDSSGVDAGVVSYALTIHFAQDGDHKDFYVALDANDISALRTELDMADKKAAALNALLNKSGVLHLKQPKV